MFSLEEKFSYFDANLKYLPLFQESHLKSFRSWYMMIQYGNYIYIFRYLCQIYLRIWNYLQICLLNDSELFDICGENKIWHLLLISALTWSDKKTKQNVSRAIRKLFITNSFYYIFKYGAYKSRIFEGSLFSFTYIWCRFVALILNFIQNKTKEV